MSTAPIHADPTVAEARKSSMFDSLARLVPDELQTAYYRVLAHTRTLSPDDEMLRILEVMGILALLTRHTPKDIADGCRDSEPTPITQSLPMPPLTPSITDSPKESTAKALVSKYRNRLRSEPCMFLSEMESKVLLLVESCAALTLAVPKLTASASQHNSRLQVDNVSERFRQQLERF